ncbi:hypothetical protein Scep_029467 [Stephania cephalantha]|uniref:Uncharacterized protein n=1 Tax=Stephania cephalantha TaxID=152367 RepID=A0AAP0HFV7_9MAGN
MDRDELHQNKVFMRDHIPVKVALLGYVMFAVISTTYHPPHVPTAQMAKKMASLQDLSLGLIKSIASISSDLMHDLKIGHLTYTSPVHDHKPSKRDQWDALWLP